MANKLDDTDKTAVKAADKGTGKINRKAKSDATVFGQRMATLRKDKGLTQSQLAALLHTTRANIEYYENRAANPTLDFILRAASVLDVSPAEMISNSSASRLKPGPDPQFLILLEKARRLPRKQQKFLNDFIHDFLQLFSIS